MKRRSRSRDRDRDRRYRDSGRDRRHRDSDRDRHRRERDHDRIRSRSPKETPWVPPPLPEHLRSLTTVPWVPPPRPPKQQHYSSSTPWGPTSVQPAAPARPALQNQFQNDGSFIELFRQQMQAANSVPQSGDSNSGDATECSETPAVAAVAATSVTVSSSATAPTLAATSCGLPVVRKYCCVSMLMLKLFHFCHSLHSPTPLHPNTHTSHLSAFFSVIRIKCSSTMIMLPFIQSLIQLVYYKESKNERKKKSCFNQILHKYILPQLQNCAKLHWEFLSQQNTVPCLKWLNLTIPFFTFSLSV